MLVLSRKAGESILLHMRDGRTVDVKVLQIRHPPGRQPVVSLGVGAPDDVVILREEVQMESGPRRPGGTMK